MEESCFLDPRSKWVPVERISDFNPTRGEPPLFNTPAGPSVFDSAVSTATVKLLLKRASSQGPYRRGGGHDRIALFRRSRSPCANQGERAHCRTQHGCSTTSPTHSFRGQMPHPMWKGSPWVLLRRAARNPVPFVCKRGGKPSPP